jgi:hypothetical protein
MSAPWVFPRVSAWVCRVYCGQLLDMYHCILRNTAINKMKTPSHINPVPQNTMLRCRQLTYQYLGAYSERNWKTMRIYARKPWPDLRPRRVQRNTPKLPGFQTSCNVIRPGTFNPFDDTMRQLRSTPSFQTEITSISNTDNIAENVQACWQLKVAKYDYHLYLISQPAHNISRFVTVQIIAVLKSCIFQRRLHTSLTDQIIKWL